MEIEVQLGSFEEKEIRKKEISTFLDSIGNKIIDKLNLKKIIVSSNLTETVNKLEDSSKEYFGKRYMIECHAKIIYGKNNDRYIVFSDFWNNELDYNNRFFYFTHEIYHLVNEAILPKIINDGTAKYQYLKLIEKMYDEYSASRFAIDIFKKPIDPNLKECFKFYYNSFFNELQNHKTFYEPLKTEILRFRYFEIDINKFLQNSMVFIEPIYVYLSYVFAYKDSLKFIEEIFNKSNKNLFFHEYTYKLFDKIKNWYCKSNINFENGLEEITGFFSCLSVSFHNTPQGGIYVKVHDI